MSKQNRPTRREFVARAGLYASAGSVATFLATGAAEALSSAQTPTVSASMWDLSWLERISGATDKVLFDWPTLGDPADPMTMQFADRYLENCESVYTSGKYQASIVFNIRTQAVPAGLNDAIWNRYTLGEEYKVNDPHTKQPAIRNPFWHRAPDLAPGYTSPSLQAFVERSAVLLVCDFALGHLAKRLADKRQLAVADVHADLLKGLAHGAYAVPSGVYGMAKAQNVGCALVRMV